MANAIFVVSIIESETGEQGYMQHMIKIVLGVTLVLFVNFRMSNIILIWESYVVYEDQSELIEMTRSL